MVFWHFLGVSVALDMGLTPVESNPRSTLKTYFLWKAIVYIFLFDLGILYMRWIIDISSAWIN